MSCVFCSIIDGSLPSFRVYEDETSLALLDLGQATAGHTLVVPKQRTPDLLTATPEQAAAVMQSAQVVAQLLDTRLSPAGFNIVQSSGVAAWQEVFHLHVHVVPRYADDGLVPPWTGSHPTQEELTAVHETITGPRT